MFTHIIKFLHVIKAVNSKVTATCLKMEIFSIKIYILRFKTLTGSDLNMCCIFPFFLFLCQYGGHIARAACLHFYDYEVSFYFLLR